MCLFESSFDHAVKAVSIAINRFQSALSFYSLASVKNKMWLEIFAAGFALFFLWTYFYSQKSDNVSEKQEQTQKIPGMSPSHPEEGNRKEIKENVTMSQFLIKLHDKFGPIACFWEGKKMSVSIAAPDLFKDVRRLYETPRDLFLETQLVTGPRNLLSCDPEEIKRRRKIYDHHFMMKACKSYTKCFHEIAQELIMKWKIFPEKTPVPLLASMTRAAMAALTRTTFGDYFKDENNLDSYQKRFDRLFKNLDPLPEQHTEDYKMIVAKIQELRSIVRQILDDRKSAKNKDEDNPLLIDALLEEDFTDDERLADSVLFIGLGYFITAAMMTWFIYEMTNNPEIQEKVYKELKDVLGNEPLTLEKLPQLTYMRKVIDETLRLHLKSGYTGRLAVEDIKVGNYLIPQGTTIYQAFGYLCNDTNVWPQHDKFDPERFTPENNKSRNAYAFKPFGYAGKRTCPGQTFAYSEMSIFFSEWLRQYRFHLVPGQQIKPSPGVLMTPEKEIMVTIERRS